MTDRHTASSITDAALTVLYDQLETAERRIETLEHVAAGNLRHVQLIVPELERAVAERDQHSATIERVTAECDAIDHLRLYGQYDVMHVCRTVASRIRTALAGPAKPLAQPTDGSLCRCGHTRNQHQDNTGLGGAQCRACPGDEERSWRHPYTPTERSTPC